MEGLGLGVPRPETPAVHVESQSDSVGQEGDEHDQEDRNGREAPSNVEEKPDAGRRLQEGKEEGDGQEQDLGNDAVCLDQNGERLRFEKLGDPRVEEHPSQQPPDDLVESVQSVRPARESLPFTRGPSRFFVSWENLIRQTGNSDCLPGVNWLARWAAERP